MRRLMKVDQALDLLFDMERADSGDEGEVREDECSSEWEDDDVDDPSFVLEDNLEEENRDTE